MLKRLSSFIAVAFLLSISGSFFVQPVFAAETQCKTDPYCLCGFADPAKDSIDSTNTVDTTTCYKVCEELKSDTYMYSCAGEVKGQGNIGVLENPTVTQEKQEPYIPALSVPIPGLDLENSVSSNPEGHIVTNMIGLYVNAVFSYAIILAALVGVLMFVIAGFQYMTAGGSQKNVTKAKERMRNTTVGIVLLFACYSLAFLLDPRTTKFDPLTLQNVEAIEYFPPEGEEESDMLTPNGSLTGAASSVLGDYIKASSGSSLDADALTALQTAAKSFHDKYGINVVVASAKRDLNQQASLFVSNCLKNGGYCNPPTCNPSSIVKKVGGKYQLQGSYAGLTNGNSIVSAMVQHAAYGNCPHTSAIAVDLWCDDKGGSWKHNPNCQDKLIKVMLENGFCRLKSEPWHFEFDSKKVSTSSCSKSWNSVTYYRGSKTHSPPGDCNLWNFKTHKCVQKLTP